MANRHDGHRNRLYNRVKMFGLENLAEHEQLEYLLYTIIPRSDTNYLAHDLLARFGNLYRIFHTPAKEIAKINGIGIRAASFLAEIPSVMGIYKRSEVKQGLKFDSMEKTVDYINSLFSDKNGEAFYAISLNSEQRLLKYDKISEGDFEESTIYVRRIVQSAMSNNAHSIIVAHNHIAGGLSPTEDDLTITKNLTTIFDIIDVKFKDHIIIGSQQRFLSLREEGIL